MNDCDAVDLASAYDNHGFSVSNRDKSYKTLIQAQSCSNFEALNGKDLLGKAFFQFPSVHNTFEVVYQLRVVSNKHLQLNKSKLKIKGDNFTTQYLAVGRTDIPASAEIDQVWHEVSGFNTLDIAAWNSMSSEEIAALECAVLFS